MSMAQIIEDAKHEAFIETFGEQIKIIIRKAKRMNIQDETIILAFLRTFNVDSETAMKLYEAVKE